MDVRTAGRSLSRTLASSYWLIVNVTTAAAVLCSRPWDLQSRKVWRPTLGLVLSAGVLTQPPYTRDLEEEENRTNRLPVTRSKW